MDGQRRKELGAVYTPTHVAKFLVRWAVQKPTDLVLDASTGEGVFIQESINRLRKLGASEAQICSQVFGVEYDTETYHKMLRNLSKSNECNPKNLLNADFFDVSPKRNMDSYAATNLTFPLVNASVGNPPYVERQRVRDLKKIRNKVLSSPEERFWLSRLTDIYGYFLIHLTQFLKPNGRIALIISDTWLSMRFGEKLKLYLLKKFKIKAIVGFRERVFSEAMVRTILLFIEKGKKNEIEDNQTSFIELRNSAELDYLEEDFSNLKKRKKGIFTLPQKELDPSEPWSIYLKAPKTYFSISKKPLISSLSSIADSVIGIQTLAKNFYLLEESELKKLNLEESYFRRIAVSPRNAPCVIEKEEDVNHFILYCDKPKEELKNTALLNYIEKAEKKEITIRGKTQKVTGINNIPRLMKARRKPWYNLKSNLERWDRAQILLPRRIYESYICCWNKAKVVENENFIRIYPRNENYILPLLAFLNSSLGEFFVRVQANIYGGGVYDLKPNDVKRLRVLDLSKLKDPELNDLKLVYEEFLGNRNRLEIDEVVYRILKMNKKEISQVHKKLSELQELSIRSKG